MTKLPLKVDITHTNWVISPVETILLSYPHSANTWFRYCVEFLSGRATNGATRHNSTAHVLATCAEPTPQLIRLCPMGAIFDIGVDQGLPAIMHKEHELTPEHFELDAKLILLVRDYREVVVRRCCYTKSNPRKVHPNWQKLYTTGVCGYVGRLKNFHSWQGPKLVVYYEDIVDDLAATLESVAAFLDISCDRIPELLRDIDTHRANGVALYNNWAVSYTEGMPKPKFHSAAFTAKQLAFIDNVTRGQTGPLFSYLERYAK